MAKTHRRRAARAAKEAAAASARAAACSSRRAAVSLLSRHDWTQLGTALDGLLRVEFPSSFTDLDLLCPMEAWLVVDLAYVGVNGNAVSSLRSGLVRAVDALARLCLLAETLRAWDDLWLSVWARVLTSDMCQDRYSGERDRQISHFIKCTKAKGLHVALRWHGRRLCHHVIDPLRRFLEAATGVQQQENDAAVRHVPVQIALWFEQCQLTSADLQSLHSLVKVSPSGDFTPPRLCNQTELQQLSLRGNALYDNHLEALTALLEDPSARRINGLVLGDTFPSDVDLHDTYAATFQRALTAALQPKPSMVPSLDSNNGYDPGVCVSLDECKGVHTRLVEAIENALVQATRPIRGVSFASLALSDFGAILRFTRLLMTPLPTATLDCQLNLSYVNIDREQDEVEEALFVSLAEMVIEAIPRFLNVLTGVTCRLLHAEIFEDPFLQVVDTAASEHVTTTTWYDVVSVTHNGFFQLSLPTKAGGVSTAATGWVSSTAIASLRRGDAVLVGANYSQLILDGTKHSHLGPPNSGRLIMGLVASLGANLTRLSLRNNSKIFNELPSYLSRCPELLELNACDGGCSHWENGSYYRRNWLEASEDLGANLQALSMADCSIDAASLLLPPPLSSLRYLQLANNLLKGEGLDQLLMRLKASRSLQYVDVRSNETLDPTDAQYFASVKSTIERGLKDEYVSVDARMAFLSVLPRLEDEYDLPQCIPHDAVAAIFEMAGTRASRGDLTRRSHIGGANLQCMVLALRRLSPRACRLRVHTMSSVSAASANDGAVPREPRIIQYYLKQGVFDAAQLEQIKATLNAPLPSCFRVNPNAPDAAVIQEKLAGEFQQSFDGASWNGLAVTPPHELSWYPLRHGAWQLDGGKNALGKAARTHEGVRAFRDWLLFETLAGNITRQEAVSMVPAMLLGIQREHRVLDLCAAPGSKTSQVMENLSAVSASEPSRQGFIVANDANEKRGYLLVHQLQRLGLETAVVTCHLGQHFPGLFINGKLQSTNVFDRVICDVPCTGDGTIRKNRNIWGAWFPGGALSLHNVQLDLALRAAALLQPDGLMVYSTCSFNPLENEAVVAELLRRADGALEVVDASELLPGLVRRPGMTQWQAAWLSREANADLEWFATYDAVPKTLKGFRICKSMFPPEDDAILDSLRHCMRLFPTDQNTGGFFVTLLRKKHALPGDGEVGLPSFEAATPRRPHPENGDFKCHLCGDATHTVRNCPQSRNGQRLAREEQEKVEKEAELATQPKAPLHGYTKLAPEFWDVIQEFYGIQDGFPHEHLCSRSDGATSICLVNAHVQETCLQRTDLRVLNTGVRCFAKVVKGTSKIFRVTEEGMDRVLPFLTKRKLEHATLDDLTQLLHSRVGGAVANERFSLPLQRAAAEMETESGVGPVVVILTPEEEDDARGVKPFALPVWLGAKSLGLLVDKGAQQQLQEALARRAPSA